jgi:4'-phosphopantetheinyl transferase
MIFWTAIEAVGARADALAARWCTPEDRAAAARHTLPPAARHSLMARAALRALLFHATGRSDWRIQPDARGKPFALAPSGGGGPAVSLSHSRGLVAAAVGDVASLGIDIEYMRPRDFPALAAYAFGPAEAAYVATASLAGFYKIWTLREAIAKAVGAGLRLAANRTDLIVRPERDGFWTEPDWALFHTAPTAGYSLAVAADRPGADAPVRIDATAIG